MATEELIHANNLELERALLASALADPDILSEPWAIMPDEVWYSEKHRIVWREMKEQHRVVGLYDLATLVDALRQAGNGHLLLEAIMPAINAEGPDVATSAYAFVYADRLRRLYVKREKARALREYEAAIAKGEDEGVSRLLLEATLTALDSTLANSDDRSDDEIVDLITSSAYPSGYADLDHLTGGLINPGLNILAARPSVGKSALARGMVRHAARRGTAVYWYSQDQAENQILQLEIARHRRMASTEVKHLPRTELVAGVSAIRREVWQSRVTLVDRPLKLAQLMAAIKSAMPGLVVVDYVQLLDAELGDEYENITATSKALKTLALELRVPVLALAQFNREQASGKPPNMANVRGSGQLEQDADQFLALDRDTTNQTDSEAWLWVLKSKIGPTGKVKLHWHAKYASFENAGRV